MLAEADFLLIDVQLFEVVYHFFLEAALVRLEKKVGNGFLNLRAYSGNALSLEGLHLVFQFQNIVDATRNILVQSDSLASSELVCVLDRFLYRSLYLRPILFRDYILSGIVNDIRETENRVHVQCRVHLDSQLVAQCRYLTEILFGEVGIDMLGRRYCIGLECDEEIDCTPVQFFCKHLAYNKFLIFRQKGGLDVDISSLAVQRSDFYGQFACFQAGLGLAVSCH